MFQVPTLLVVLRRLKLLIGEVLRKQLKPEPLRPTMARVKLTKV